MTTMRAREELMASLGQEKTLESKDGAICSDCKYYSMVMADHPGFDKEKMCFCSQFPAHVTFTDPDSYPCKDFILKH
jgi:hypothetical protein